MNNAIRRKNKIVYLKNKIWDIVDDHRKHFKAYPMEVEVNGKVYDFDAYWAILDSKQEIEVVLSASFLLDLLEASGFRFKHLDHDALDDAEYLLEELADHISSINEMEAKR